MLEDRHPIANLPENTARESIPDGFLYLTFFIESLTFIENTDGRCITSI
jgi:hypothetical protein